MLLIACHVIIIMPKFFTWPQSRTGLFTKNHLAKEKFHLYQSSESNATLKGRHSHHYRFSPISLGRYFRSCLLGSVIDQAGQVPATQSCLISPYSVHSMYQSSGEKWAYVASCAGCGHSGTPASYHGTLVFSAFISHHPRPNRRGGVRWRTCCGRAGLRRSTRWPRCRGRRRTADPPAGRCRGRCPG